ncbi:MAG: glycosyltransferase [Candidatus Moranbacteria bacterium]|nr:glycosyltransferase [Candidatus Moranbacteria bacterium]
MPHILIILQNLPFPQDQKVFLTAKALVEKGYQVSIISPGLKNQPKKKLLENISIHRYPQPPKPQGFFGYLWEYSYSFLASFYLAIKVYLSNNSSPKSKDPLTSQSPSDSSSPMGGSRRESPSESSSSITPQSPSDSSSPSIGGGLRRGFSSTTSLAIDVVHLTNPPDFMFLIALFFKLFGVKFVYDQHDLMPEMFLAKFSNNKKHILYKALLFLEKLSLKTCNLHLSTCELGQKTVKNRHKFKAPSIIVQNAVNPKKHSTKPPSNSSSPSLGGGLRRNFLSESSSSITSQSPSESSSPCTGGGLRRGFLALYFGVMGTQDGVDKLLKSIRYLIHNLGRKDIKFALLGDGDDFKRLKQMAKDYKIQKQVHFTGWADKNLLNNYLQIAHIGLIPEPKNDYTDNSLHNKVLEYMAAGLPFVTYELSQDKKIAKNSAIYVKDGQKDSEIKFAKAIVDLIDSPKKRQKMGEYAKNRFKNEKYAWKYQKKELIKAYESLLVD